MTSRRTPSGRHDAFMQSCLTLARVTGRGWAAVVEATGLSESQLRKIGLPGLGEPKIRDAQAIDAALKEHGEEPENLISYAGRLGDRPDTPESPVRRIKIEARTAKLMLESPRAEPTSNFRNMRRDVIEAMRDLASLLLDLDEHESKQQRGKLVDLPERKKRA